ncbi:MAG: glycosyltransferase family 4 protein [Thermoanaerobaculia bacterium]|nr:glycosyltransferase family 4 protein [Thermoanaerobaculia bacterium]
MKVAVWSPLPPAPSGIADYTAELLPALAAHAELELVAESGAALAPALARWPRRPAAALARAVARGEVDTVLYHLGDHRGFHAAIWRACREIPGVAVLHEIGLHHLVRDLTLHAGDAEGYVRELARAAGAEGEAAARRALATGIPLDPLRWPLSEPVVDASRGVIVHSAWARDRLLARRSEARVAVVRHHLSLGGHAPVGRDEARRRLGLDLGAPLVAAFGVVAPSKRPRVLLRAFRALRARHPAARLLFVGAVGGELAAVDWVPPELGNGVEVLGRTSFARLLLHMEAVDVAVNLRHPSGGETSGTLIRLLGLGTPVAVTNDGPTAELPDDVCAKVDLGVVEEEMLVETLDLLLRDEPLRRQMGANARRYAANEHALARSAAGYAQALRAAIGSTTHP